MSDSILTSVKTKLGLMEGYDHFDEEIIMDINSAFLILNQLGVGTESAFKITGYSETWTDFLADERIEMVKSYIPLRVRLLFDPPSGSYLLESIKDQISEFEFRMMVEAERKHLPEADMSSIYVRV